MLRFVLLGLLGAEPRYGYELRAVFERFLAGTWPLNIGQVYGALGKLQAEGLVACQVVPQDATPDRKVYALTEDGRRELDAWLDSPDEGPVRLRDEFYLKIAVRALSEGAGAATLLRRQREHHLRSLAELDRAQREPGLHPATALLLDGAMLRLEADLKWFDLCERRLKELG